MIFVRANDVKDNLKVYTDLASRTVVVSLSLDWLKETMYEMGVDNISKKVLKQSPDTKYPLFIDVAFRRAISSVFSKYFEYNSNLVARATCHEDDVFDWNFGYHLAKERLLMKIRKIESKVVDKALKSVETETRIIESYFTQAFEAVFTDLIKNSEDIPNTDVKAIDD